MKNFVWTIMNNPFFQDEIEFEPTKHIYTVKKTGKKLISVSTLIHNYCKKFDEFGFIIKKCAAKEGITVEQLKARWDKKRDDSCDRGHLWHEQIENFLLTSKIINGPDKDIVKKVKKKIKFEGIVYPEVLVYSTDLMICGTADIVEYFPETNEIIIKDWKTNESLWKKSYNKLLYPLNHLNDNQITKYSLQLSLYAYLLELRGFIIKKDKLCIFWINPESRDIEIIPINYLRNEVMNMINHYKNGYEFF